MTVNTDAGRVDLLRVLGEPIRWHIVELLAAEELCVCHMVEELGVPQPLVSHHLRILRDVRLVETEKWRYWTYYRLRPERLEALAGAIATMADADASRTRRPCC